jgi:UDP-glucose 4-epimerase
LANPARGSRVADVVGPDVSSPLTDYLRMRVVPTVLGYDARLQLLHDSDLLAVLHHATVDGVHGTFNVAGSGILMLSQAMRRLGRPTVSVPGFALSAAGTLGRQAGVVRLSPELISFLRFGRGMDTSRLRTILGFRPTYSTAEALADLAASDRTPPVQQPSGPARPRVVAHAGSQRV